MLFCSFTKLYRIKKYGEQHKNVQHQAALKTKYHQPNEFLNQSKDAKTNGNKNLKKVAQLHRKIRQHGTYLF